MFEGDPELFLNYEKGVPEKHECYLVGVWKLFLQQKHFLLPPNPPPPSNVNNELPLVWMLLATGYRTRQIRLGTILTATVLS